MMNLFKKSRGAVSIFLIIILVPTLAIAGIFVDMSRAEVSKEVVSTAAELSLNTTLSKYDTKLKDYYGLIASAQSTDDVVSASKTYFVDALKSAGFEVSAAEMYFDNVMAAFGADESITDMLKLSVEGETSLNRTEKAALDQPAMLKKSIVEFQKYRAPVNAVASLFDSLTKSDVAKQAQQASKQTRLIEAKKEFGEAEKKLIQKAKEAYEAIKNYQEFKTHTGKNFSDEKYLDELSEYLHNPKTCAKNDSLTDYPDEQFEAVYKKAHEILVKDLYTTRVPSSIPDDFRKVNMMGTQSIATQQSVTTYSAESPASASSIQSLISDFNSKLQDYYNKKSDLDTAWGKVGNYQSGSDYKLQYWVTLSKNCDNAYGAYRQAAEAVWKAANKLSNAVDYPDEGAMAETMMKPSNKYVTFPGTLMCTLQEAYDALNSSYNSISSEVTGGGCSSFRSITSQIGQVQDSESLAKTSRINAVITIGLKAKKFSEDLEEAGKRAQTAIDRCKELRDLIDPYREAFKKWKGLAYDPELSDNKLAQQDRKIIEERYTDAQVEKFSKNDVDEVLNRLKNIKNLCNTLGNSPTGLKGIKYNGTFIGEITDYPGFRKAAKLDEKKIVRNNAELDAYVESSFKFEMDQTLMRIEVRDGARSGALKDGDAYVITDSFHPNIEKYDLKLWIWMKEFFESERPFEPLDTSTHGYDVSDEDGAKDADKDINDKESDESGFEEATKGESNSSGHSFKDWEGATLPSKSAEYKKSTISSKLGEIADFVEDLFGDFSGTFMSALTSARDDLFMLDYVFNMFTYDTFDYEGCYKLLDEETQNSLNLGNAKSKYKTVEDKWTDPKGRRLDTNKSLTLTPRNSKNNWAFGSEVEYILYGSKTNSENKVSAYGRIYAVRFALDLLPVFSEWFDHATVKAIATALEALLFIPSVLTQTLICLVITAVEAGIDIAYLKLGLPVLLIKTEDDLFCSFDSVFKGGSEGSGGSKKGRITLQYSDYLKIFFFISLMGEGENEIYVRTGDCIQANMFLATNENKEYALSKSQVYYDFKATVVMEPMWSRLLAIDNLGDISTSKGWRTIEINMRRGY